MFAVRHSTHIFRDLLLASGFWCCSYAKIKFKSDFCQYMQKQQSSVRLIFPLLAVLNKCCPLTYWLHSVMYHHTVRDWCLVRSLIRPALWPPICLSFSHNHPSIFLHQLLIFFHSALSRLLISCFLIATGLFPSLVKGGSASGFGSSSRGEGDRTGQDRKLYWRINEISSVVGLGTLGARHQGWAGVN